MKTEKVSLIIGVSISVLFGIFGFKYFQYIDTPTIQRNFSPVMESFEVLDLRVNDFKYKLKDSVPSTAPVALIAIDDASVREIGRWPWSRETVAKLTQQLIDLGAKSVAFDVIFSEPEMGNLQADAQFAKVVENNPDKIILGTFSENQFNFKPYQDLCVAEAFLKTGGDQIVKLNAGFVMDEESLETDDLNWGPLFNVIFQNVQAQDEADVLASLEKKSVEELTPYQKNFLKAHQSQALFDYCKTWLTSSDTFLDPAFSSRVAPLYLDVASKSETLKDLSFDAFLNKIRNNYVAHPIPQYGEWTSNIADLQNPANYTASFIAQLDSDGYVRRYPLFFRSGNKLGSSFIPSLALQGYLLSGPYRAELKIATSKAGRKSIDEFNIIDTSTEPEKKLLSYPVDKSGQVLVNYYGRQMSIPYVSAKEFFNDKDTLKVQRSVLNTKSKQLQIELGEFSKKEFLKDRSLIIGATAIGLYDLRNTPIEANYPGPEIHATMLANLLEQKFLKPWDHESKYLPWLILALGCLLTVMWAYFGSLLSFAVLIIVMVSFSIFDFWLFNDSQVLIHSYLVYGNILSVFFSVQLYKYFTEEKKKRELKTTFSKYVSPAVVDELLKDVENLKLGGRKERMSVFFSDVRGFTTISEKLSPEELSRVLNLYLTPMTELVFKNKGTLDKYMGDAIMAFFGAPVKNPQHAAEACRCALDSIVKLKELQKEFADQGLPYIDIGIGINTGEMSVGNMGSNIVQNYTVMGDSVNLASRLEGINKEYGTRIVISEFTYGDVKKEFTAREIDRVRVKGKLEPVRIFELLCEGIPDQSFSYLTDFNQGYRLYHDKKFSEALGKFNSSLNLSQDDPVSKLYIQRCQDYLEEAPPSDWDGVFVMKTK